MANSNNRQLDGYGRCTGCGTDFSACAGLYHCAHGCQEPDPAPWSGLYTQLSAIEALGVGRQGRGLNVQGGRVLRYLRARRIREEAR